MFAWSAQRLFAGVHPKPKHCLCVIIDGGGSLRSARWGIKFPKMVYHPHESLYPGDIWRDWELGHSGGLLWVCMESRAINDVSEESELKIVKIHICHVKGQPSVLQALKNSSYASIMFWLVHPVNEDIIHLTDVSLPKPSSILDIVRWKISGAELIPNGSLLKQKRPNGVTKVVSNFDSSSKGICQNPLLASSLEKILTISQFSEVLIHWRHWVYLTLDCFVKVRQVNTDTYTAIWFKDRDDTCTPFSWTLLQARSLLAESLFLLDFYLWNQWMGNLSGIVETERPSIRAKCYVAFILKLSQSAAECRKFGCKICWSRGHLFNIFVNTSYESYFDTGSPAE